MTARSAKPAGGIKRAAWTEGQKARLADLMMKVTGHGRSARIIPLEEITKSIQRMREPVRLTTAVHHQARRMFAAIRLDPLADGATITPAMARQIERIKALGGRDLPRNVLIRLCQCRRDRLEAVLHAAGIDDQAEISEVIETTAEPFDGKPRGWTAFLAAFDRSGGRFEDYVAKKPAKRAA